MCKVCFFLQLTQTRFFFEILSTMSMCVSWCCPDETQFPSYWSKLAGSVWLPLSNGPILYSICLNKEFGGRKAPHSRWFLDHCLRWLTSIRPRPFSLDIALRDPPFITSKHPLQIWIDFVFAIIGYYNIKTINTIHISTDWLTLSSLSKKKFRIYWCLFLNYALTIPR